MLLTRIASGGAALFLFATSGAAQVSAPAQLTGEITNVRGAIYRVQFGSEVSVFVVTLEGIVLADPLDREAAAWLEMELTDRFPDRPVRYVIHTTHRFERSEGAARFNDTAQILAHHAFNGQVSNARRGLSPDLSRLDVNRDGALALSELQDHPRVEMVRAHDRNNDGAVTSEEIYAFVQSPESTYGDRRTITLGERTIEILHLGSAFGAESTAVLFPQERVLFVDRQPDMSGRLFTEDSSPSAVARWVRNVAALDVDVVLTGRGEAIPHADIVGLNRYITDLFREVVAAYESGRPAAQVQASATFDAHKGAAYDAQRSSHIEASYRGLHIFRIAIHGTGAVNVLGAGHDYCAAYTGCERPRSATGTIAGMSLSSRRFVVVAEVSVSNQLVAWRTSPARDEAFAHRETVGAILGGYMSPPDRLLSLNLLGGISYIVSDAQGISRRKQVFANLAGIRPFAVRQSAVGLTGGADLNLALGSRLDVIMPLRITYASAESTTYWPGPVFLQGGIGLRYRLFRGVR